MKSKRNFQKYILYLTNMPTSVDPVPITVYCDSESVITRIKRHVSTTTIYPNTTVADDYDVYSAITRTVRQLHPIQPTFRHVKGHQDENNRRRPLTLPECLNIDCDTWAAALLPHARRLKPMDHPRLPTALPHIVVHGQTIVRDIPGALRHAAMTPHYRIYLKENMSYLILQLMTSTGKRSNCLSGD